MWHATFEEINDPPPLKISQKNQNNNNKSNKNVFASELNGFGFCNFFWEDYITFYEGRLFDFMKVTSQIWDATYLE